METIFNVILFLPFFTSLFWAVTLSCSWKRNTRPQNIWAVCMYISAATGFVWGIFFIGVDFYLPFYMLDPVYTMCALLFFPLVSMYFRSLADSRKFTWKQYVKFIPGIVMGVMAATLFIIMGPERSMEYLRKIMTSNNTPQFAAGSAEQANYIVGVLAFSAIAFLQAVSAMVYSTRNLARYRKELSNYFSDLEGKALGQNTAVLAGFYIILLLIILFIVFLWLISYDHYYLIRHILMGAMGICIFFMGYWVSRGNSTSIANIPPEVPGDIPANGSELSKAGAKILPELNRLMDEDRMFLQPRLTLDDIARALNSNRTYISQVINEVYKCNFHDFINCRRIEFAKELHMQNPAYTQEQVATESGFTHPSSFSRIFKKQTGITFREWLKSA